MTDTPPPSPLSDEQRARLRQRLARTSGAAPVRIPQRGPDGGRPPLSFAQEQLWFLSRLAAGGGAGYAITLSWILDGPLAPSPLRQALEAIVHRHEVLRTVFESEGGQVWQSITPPQRFDLPVEDLSARGADDGTAAALRRTEVERPFDLVSGPLFRARLIRFSDVRHELIVGVHHIVADGWSLSVFARELVALYDAFARGVVPALPPLPVQYADYAVWQRQQLQGVALERQMAFWREQLADAPTLELPPDRSRPAVPAFRGSSARGTLGRDLSDGVRRLARESRATVFMTLLAAFKVVLLRYTGQHDLVVGTPVANRTAAEVEPLIGFFVNSVVLRTRLDEGMTLRDAVARVRDVCFGAFEHQGTPFEKLVDAFCSDRDPSRNPLFQIAFNVLDGTGSSPEAAGVRFGALRGLSEKTRFDLEAHVTDLGDTFALDFLYDAALYEPVTIERLLKQYVHVVETLVATPDAAVASVSLLEAEERTALLAGGTGAAGPDPGVPSLGARFSAAVAAHADAIALEDGSTRWTYAALGADAAQLAGVLRAAGVGPNVVVGVWQERNVGLLATLAGITVAGGAYLPLDPGQPASRAAAVLASAHVRVVVTTDALAASVPAGPWTVVTREAVAAAPRTPLSAVAPVGTADDLAYVLFTSGSTGTPKGVAVPQRAVVRLVVGTDYVSLGPHTVMGQAATAAFDAATFELWGAWLHGARLVVIPTPVAIAPVALGTYLQRTGVTTLFLTTALVHQIGREAPAALRGLETLLFGGETVEPRWVAAIQAAGGPRRILHVYGPTENTTFSTWCPVGAVPPEAATLPIGGPIAQSTCYVVDAAGRLVPVGVPGELLVGGAGLATGYLGGARQTAERFVPDPFGAAAGARLYRTGDVVRWTAPGVLAFIGRRDGQIKLRGNRIELGEVESALRSVPGVAAAAVMVQGSGAVQQLVAYVEPLSEATAPGAMLTGAAVRSALQTLLPAYMVPALVGVLPRLPLNVNGKVDRRALPVLTAGLATSESAAAPRSVRETQIAAVWCEVLGLDTVGVEESFFDVGGHSLLLVRVQAGLESALGRAIPLVTLFQYPTIAALAAHLSDADAPSIERTPASTRVAADAPIAIIGLAGRFPGVPDVETLWSSVREGRELLHRFSMEELEATGVPASLRSDTRYVPVRGVLDGADLFDAGLFSSSPRDAALLDPQQRVLLECAWTALESAGYAPQTRRRERVGIWAGTSANTYVAQASRAALRAAGSLAVLVASDKDFLATRVSYKLDLGGPAVTVQTACSTSLVAVHLACQALRAGECEVALAGGVSITVPAGGYVYHPDGIASPDGHCRPFDAAAAGTVAGNGVGVVVLKPLEAALRDGDRVHAVIRGSAINNDGADKVGFTAPSVRGQAEAIAAAQAAAGVAPETIGYVEAHGTGTALGDPIEVAALRQVWGEGAGPATCGLGSVKGSVGHLDAAAGVTGLIVAVKALQAAEVPATAHFTAANPQLDLGPFTVAGTVRPWPQPGIRRAGVSSFGMGGTNAHVVLEEAPAVETAQADASPGTTSTWQVMPVSGQTPEAVAAAAAQLADYLDAQAGREGPPDGWLRDVSHTQQVGRAALPIRRVAVGQDAASIAAALRAAPDVVAGRPPLVWMCPGQGTQVLRMGAALHARPGAFRDELDACAVVLMPRLGADVRQILYPAAEQEAWAVAQLQTTAWTQAALVAVGLALAAQLREWGITPTAVVGHSVGEITAAALAGVLTREAALELAATRGQAMAGAPAGGMLAVAAAIETVTPLLGTDLWLAAVNRATQCVVAGGDAALQRAEATCAAQGVRTQRLPAVGAFHSGLMAGAVAPLQAVAGSLPHARPHVAWVSSQTGAVLTDIEATDPAYWARQVVAPVQWAAAVTAAAVHVGAPAVWLELGPGHTLTHLVRGTARLAAALAPLDGPDADASVAQALGALWTAGIAPDWAAVHAPARPRRLPLPTYPFQRQRYWLESAPSDEQELVKRDDPATWLYLPCWKQTPAPASQPPIGPCVLIARDDRFGRSLHAELTARHARVVTVDVDDAVPHAYDERLADALRDATAAHVVHATSVGTGDVLDAGLFSVIALVKALAPYDRVDIRLAVVTDGAHIVRGDEEIDPGKATLAGLCAVVPLEHPRIATSVVDIERYAANAPSAVARLAEEILAPSSDAVVAHRGGRRWIQTFEPIPPKPVPRRGIAPGGTYLITGGTGRIGLVLARHFTEGAGARVILASRHATRHEPATLGLAANRVRLIDADVADEARFREALAAAEAEFGPVRGVIHAAAATSEADFPLLQHLDRDVCARHLRTKIDGTRVLARVLGDRALDFCVLMSSISSRLGGGGFGGYAAANAFMDAFAELRAANGDTAWISAGWDGWRFDADGAPGETARLAMTAAEGIAALERLLGSADGGSVVVSTADLPRRAAALRARAVAAPVDAAPRFPRPVVSVEFAEPKTEVERLIATAWQSALGIDRVGRHDNFVELGGHSLLGVQLMASLSTALGVRLSQRDLWEMPTVAGLAAKVEGTDARALHENVDRQVLEALETIHNLSDEEIERLLSE